MIHRIGQLGWGLTRKASATAAATTTITRQHRWSSSSSSAGIVPVSVREVFDKFVPYAQAYGVILTFGASVCGVVAYVTHVQTKLGGQLDLLKVELEKKIEVQDKELEKKIEVQDKELERKIEEHGSRTLERFLTYGYAEEYQRLQQKAGVYKKGLEEREEGP